MTTTQLAGKRVLVMGLGRFGGGVGAAAFCARHGASVLVTDTLPADQLTDSINRLRDLPIDFRLGGHLESDFAAADLVVVNPAVDPRNNRYLHAAAKAGATLTSEIGLLLQRLDRNRVIGVTGTAGKSTTTALIGHALAHILGPDRARVGGNIGGSLLTEADSLPPDAWVVLELSSFMLEMLQGFSPHIAIVTNVADNHLDRHATLDAYVHAKKTILRHQTHDDRAILGPGLADWRFDTPATHILVDQPLDIPLLIPGRHNQLNAALALAALECLHIDRAPALRALQSFPGLPHRLQLVAEHNAVRFYNDSKSTTPAAAMLAIDAFPPRSVHLILGGYDKQADLTPLAHYAARRAAAIYTIGHTGPTIAAAVESIPDHCPLHRCGLLDLAVKDAIQHAAPEQSIVLSPACASWDQFENYEKRGAAFAESVLRYTHRE